MMVTFEAFKVLAQETRIRILRILMEHECSAFEVTRALNISPSRASRNLTALHNAGFLKLRKDGHWSFYSVEKEHLSDLEAIQKGR